jgi:hypothetical protein
MLIVMPAKAGIHIYRIPAFVGTAFCEKLDLLHNQPPDFSDLDSRI